MLVSVSNSCLVDAFWNIVWVFVTDNTTFTFTSFYMNLCIVHQNQQLIMFQIQRIPFTEMYNLNPWTISSAKLNTRAITTKGLQLHPSKIWRIPEPTHFRNFICIRSWWFRKVLYCQIYIMTILSFINILLFAFFLSGTFWMLIYLLPHSITNNYQGLAHKTIKGQCIPCHT